MRGNKKIALICGMTVVVLAIIATIIFLAIGNSNKTSDLIIKKNVKVIT